LYLTAGQFKGRKIQVPPNVQPTLSKVRESVFNILLQYDLADNKFLNMFSGSAIMGLEAISRGYKTTELEINPKVAQIIKSNYKNLGLTPNLIICDSLKYQTEEKYDIIYVDPPWDMDYKPIILKANSILSNDGVIILEYDKTKNIDIQDILNELNIDINLVKSKKYGRCLLSILRKH
jgi:16S rRNA (guanine966-N2)-methyltransferase